VIRALGSPLGPYPESDLATDLYSASTLIAIVYESDRQISFNSLKKFVTSLPAAIGALDSHLGLHPKSDLAIDLYFGSTPIAIMDESDHQIRFNILKKFMTSLTAAIGALGSPLAPHPESDLVIDLYSGSTTIANMDESDRQISFNCLNKSVILLSVAIRASGPPLGPYPERDLATDLYSCSTPIAIKNESNHQISFRQLQEIYNTTTRGDQGI
jgi:hypothetical protein